MGMSINIGDEFGRLTVLKETKLYRADRPRKAYICLCDCGKKKTVREDSLLSGRTTSCGCLMRERLMAARTKHGGFGTRLHSIWQNMKQRCFNPRNNGYPYYGGKGVSICDEWRDFAKFRGWAESNGYHDDLTIDRVRGDGDYEPSNCRWIPQITNTIRAHLGKKHAKRRIA